jgi:hypothetical protein
MKKTIAIILTIISLVIILDSFHVGHALMMFYIAGLIPGTNVALNGSQMLELFAIAAGFTVARIMLFTLRSFMNFMQTVSSPVTQQN